MHSSYAPGSRLIQLFPLQFSFVAEFAAYPWKQQSLRKQKTEAHNVNVAFLAEVKVLLASFEFRAIKPGAMKEEV